MPPIEDAVTSKSAAHGLEFFGHPLSDTTYDRHVALARTRPDERLVFLSDVYLDQPSMLEKLRRLFAGFQGMTRAPLAFILMGDFLSHHGMSHGLSSPRRRRRRREKRRRAPWRRWRWWWRW